MICETAKATLKYPTLKSNSKNIIFFHPNENAEHIHYPMLHLLQIVGQLTNLVFQPFIFFFST